MAVASGILISVTSVMSGPAEVLYTTPLSVIPDRLPTVPPTVAVVSPILEASEVSMVEVTSNVKVAVEVPPPLDAVTVEVVEGLKAVGVPEMAPVAVLKERPAGSAGEFEKLEIFRI